MIGFMPLYLHGFFSLRGVITLNSTIYIYIYRIHTNQAKAINDNTIKDTGLPMASLSYAIFLSKVFEFYNIDLQDEVIGGFNHSNKIAKPTLHHMGLRKNETSQAFKDEPHGDEGEDIDPVNVDMSIVAPVVRLENDFEKYVLKQLQTLVSNHSTYMSKFDALDKKIVPLQAVEGSSHCRR